MDKQTVIDLLDAYPHIRDKVDKHWGTEVLALYLGKLLLDTIRHDANSYEIRRGFPAPIFDALVNTFNDLVKHSPILINEYDGIR